MRSQGKSPDRWVDTETHNFREQKPACNACALSLPPHRLWPAGPPGSSILGSLQARVLEWGAVSSSRGSSQPRNGNCNLLRLLLWQVTLYPWATWEAQSWKHLNCNWKTAGKSVWTSLRVKSSGGPSDKGASALLYQCFSQWILENSTRKSSRCRGKRNPFEIC